MHQDVSSVCVCVCVCVCDSESSFLQALSKAGLEGGRLSWAGLRSRVLKYHCWSHSFKNTVIYILM